MDTRSFAPSAPLPTSASLPLWPLLLVAGLLPAFASLLALAISIDRGLVPGCNPFIEGCTSISRAARHELPNHLFRAMMLPAAVLQAISWLLLARWFMSQGAGRARCIALAGIGAVAGVALVMYGAFLGTEGRGYRLLRQYGTVLYFGLTCIAFLVAGGVVQRVLAARGAGRALVGIGVTLVVLGIVNGTASPMLGEPWRDRMQNATEWWGALLFVIGFVVLAWLARARGLGVELRAVASMR